jgi:hypothetical protein
MKREKHEVPPHTVPPTSSVCVQIFSSCCSQTHSGITNGITAVPWLRRLVAGLLSKRPVFDPGSVDKVALGQVFPRVLRFSRVNFIPPVLH